MRGVRESHDSALRQYHCPATIALPCDSIVVLPTSRRKPALGGILLWSIETKWSTVQ